MLRDKKIRQGQIHKQNQEANQKQDEAKRKVEEKPTDKVEIKKQKLETSSVMEMSITHMIPPTPDVVMQDVMGYDDFNPSKLKYCQKLINGLKRMRINLINLEKNNWTMNYQGKPVDPKEAITFMPHQKLRIRQFYNAMINKETYKTVWSMAMGTGKTYTMIGVIGTLTYTHSQPQPKDLRFIIVVPFTNLLWQTLNDLKKHLPYLNCSIFDASAYKTDKKFDNEKFVQSDCDVHVMT